MVKLTKEEIKEFLEVMERVHKKVFSKNDNKNTEVINEDDETNNMKGSKND